MHTRSFRIPQADGPTLGVHEWGSGEPTFLLIHGFGDGGFIWNEFLPQLASFGRAIAVDLRGHGDSDWDACSRYDIGAHLSDVNFVLDALYLRTFVLIGHSLGGDIAIRLAALHPGRVIRLVIVDSGPELDRAATAHIRRDFVAESRIYSGYSEYMAQLEAKLPLVSPTLRESLAKNALRSREGGYELKRDPQMKINDPLNSSSLPELWPTLKKIVCPVLIVRGVASSVLPFSVAKKMVGVVPNGSFASVSLAGHAVMIDNPEGFSAATLPFIRSAAAGIYRHD
jgi:pimeloyl-ACP methyl ester carboxylesterase